jgi:hypothetical protein
MSNSLTIRALIPVMIGLALSGCTGTPPTRVEAERYTLLSEQIDPASGSLDVRLRITGPADQTEVKGIAESIIESRRSRYSDITVRTYSSVSSAADLPYAISTLGGGAVTHQFNPKAGETRIPTH